MSRKRIFATVVLLVVCYVVLTWFFFGSWHPCRILEVKLRPGVLESEHFLWRGELETLSLKEKMMTTLGLNEQQKMRAYEEYSATRKKLMEEEFDRLRNAVKRLHDDVMVSNTPAQCVMGILGKPGGGYLSPEMQELRKKIFEVNPDARSSGK